MTGSSALNGAVTNSTGATLRMQGNGVYGLATLTVATSFTNNGAIVLTDTTSAYGATLSMSRWCDVDKRGRRHDRRGGWGVGAAHLGAGAR